MRYIKPIVWLIFIFSGASGLIYQVIWMRQLTLIFGSTVFATSTVLTAFMGGLALGKATISVRRLTKAENRRYEFMPFWKPVSVRSASSGPSF